MKICIPTEDDKGLNSRACRHYGSAPFFAMVDTDSGDLEIVRNHECREHGGSNHHLGVLKAHEVRAVVCDGIGKRAFGALHDAGIAVLGQSTQTVIDIIKSVRTGDALPLSVDEVCGGGRRGHGAGAGIGWGAGHRHGQGRGRAVPRGRGRRRRGQ